MRSIIISQGYLYDFRSQWIFRQANTPLRILLANLMHLHYLHYLILLTIAASAATSFATHLHVSF